MVNQVINVLIAGVVGAVAFIAVRALVIGSGQASCGDPLSVGTLANETAVVVNGTCGSLECPYTATLNATANCSYGGVNYTMNQTMASGIECWSGAECTLFVTILPLVIALFVVAGLFIGLTKRRGV